MRINPADNKMNKIIIVLAIVAIFYGHEVFAAEGIVVWRMEAKTGVTDKDIDSISGYVTSEVEKYSGMNAVSDADIKTILSGEEKKQRCGVENTGCIAEIGAALGVSEAVAGDLGKVDKYWLLNLRRINARDVEVIKRSSRKVEGSLGDLIDVLPSAVAELFGKEVPLMAVRSSVTVEESRQSPEEKMENPETPKISLSTLNQAAFGTFFSGVGLVVLGGIAQWQMDVAKDDFDTSRGMDSSAESRHKIWKGVNITGYVVGGAAMATGIVLWIVDATQEKKLDENKVSVGLAPNGNGFSAVLNGRW